MEPLADRIVSVFDDQSAPALPLRSFTGLVRDAGVLVTEPVVLRTLEREPRHFRVVDPWHSVRRTDHERAAATPDAHATDDDCGAWILRAPRGRRAAAALPVRPALRSLRSSLVALGWATDGRSSCDLTRWFGMVLEERHFRERLHPAELGGRAA